jgi:thiamine pyrophosphokinase
MTGIVFTGGEGPPPEICAGIVRDAGPDVLVVAADSGLELAESAGAAAAWITGDMDSLSDARRLEAYPPERILRHPHVKDFTDTELALALLRKRGCGKIVIIGGGGGRTDHFLALVSLFEKPEHPGVWFTAREEIGVIDAGETIFYPLENRKGPVSVFPLGGGPWNIESSGLFWPLDAVKWERGVFSISNEPAPDSEDGFELRAREGSFLVIRPISVYS